MRWRLVVVGKNRATTGFLEGYVETFCPVAVHARGRVVHAFFQDAEEARTAALLVVSSAALRGEVQSVRLTVLSDEDAGPGRGRAPPPG